MELFGIGIFEVLLIVLIALIVLGPQDTVRAGRNLGRAVRRFFSSPEWRALLQASREIRTIPDKLLEDTGLDHPEDILPSEAEIRKQAGLDDLERDMAVWNADISAMKKGEDTDQPAGQSAQILPPSQEPRQARLDELERDLSGWKADLSAWGNSPVIIPTPQTSPSESGQTPASEVSEQADASTVSGQVPASAEPAPPAEDQPESEPPAQESGASASTEQELK